MYQTWIDFWPMSPGALTPLRIAFSILSVIFVLATLAGFRLANPAVRMFYWIAALWMGLANFLFVGALIAWLIDLALRLAVPTATRMVARPYIAEALVAASVATAIYGLANARVLRLRRIKVELPNLPECWRDKQALLISDMHLGHINGTGFARRVAERVRELNPAVIFLAGDLFDGSKVDPRQVAAPILGLKPPLGTYFVGGNHEEFGGAKHFEEALRKAGIQVLHNESAVVDGVHIVGVPYGNATYPLHLRAFLEGLHSAEPRTQSTAGGRARRSKPAALGPHARRRPDVPI